MTDENINHWIAQAKNAYESEDFLASADFYQNAAGAYVAAGDALAAAEMKNNASVAFLRAGKPEQALAAVQGTDQTFAQAGDLKRQAMAFGNLASAQEALHQFDPAMENFTRSAEIFKQIGDREMRAYVLERISTLQLRKGKRIESLMTMENAIESKDKLKLKDRVLKGLIGTVKKLSGQS